jgi:hypothetical protein
MCNKRLVNRTLVEWLNWMLGQTFMYIFPLGNPRYRPLISLDCVSKFLKRLYFLTEKIHLN